jgi:hypothetical protein
MLTVYDLIRGVANIDAPVLVFGESGTGKELVANAIHNLGSRANRPFVAVSCGAVPETLIEADLFGHDKGAYTGAVGARESFLEKVLDGTLFLDEIGELSLHPGKTVARSPAEGVQPDWQQPHHPSAGAPHLCNSPQPRRDDDCRQISPGFLLQDQRDSDRLSRAGGPPAGHSAAGASVLVALFPAISKAGR